MSAALTFLDHGGEMARRIRAHDWAATPLGRPEDWPAPLRFALDLALASSFPTAIYWGPELRLLYNDAWAAIPAERHPWALGRPGAEVWAEIWDVVSPQMHRVLETGTGFATFDQFLPMERGGRPTETWWNYSFTPIRDETGRALGILNQGNETTRTILTERARVAEVERLREFFEQAPGAVALVHGPHHIFEIANPAYRTLVGKDDLLGRSVAEALPEVVEQGFVELLDEVFATGETFRAESTPVLLERAPGLPAETRVLDFVYQPIKDGSGRTTDIFVLANDVTERALAEAALRKSEERMQLALDSSMGVGTWVWDIPVNRVTADARFLELYGVSDVVGQGAPVEAFFANIHPQDRPEVERAIAAALAAGGPFVAEYRLVQPDGDIRWVSAQGRVFLDEDGRALRFPGISFDITERKAAEDAARAAAEDLRQANEIQAFVFALTERQRLLDTPEAIMHETSAMLRDQLRIDRAGFYRVEGDRLRFGPCAVSEALPVLAGTVALEGAGEAALAAYRAGQTLVSHDTRHDPQVSGSEIPSRAASVIGVPLLRGGEWVATFYVNAAAQRTWSPEEIAFVEAVAEISWDAVERAAAVVGLRESEEKFRAITNSIDQMVWSTRPDGHHDYFNDRWYEFTGAPLGTTDGEHWHDLFHPDDQARAMSLWRQCLETGDTFRIEYRLRHHSGSYRWMLGRAQPVHDDQGRIVRWFGTYTDIQEIVDAREVLARSREQLEAAVEERTRQLMAAEAQLRQAQKMEAVGQLTGGIAHDFNNMLAVVIGALDLLDRRMKKGETDVDRYVTAARDGASRAAALTHRLLAFSRQQPLAPEPLDINAMIEGMIELLMRTLGEDVLFETRLSGDLRLVMADPNQLENVVLNLAVNARDAMPQGGKLTIETDNVALAAPEAGELDLAPGDYVVIAVADQGHGMAPEIAARAFDPFFTTKGVGKGTGLGLSQVFGFVRQSGGAVRITTAPGAGTTVQVFFPAQHGPRPAVHAPLPPIARTPRAQPGETVLVVEDEERVRAFSVESLRELGYSVVDARDAREALRLIDRGQRVNLLFTDVVMPEMTGPELARKARERLPGLRILFTSGYTPEGAGAAPDLLTKPFDLNALACRVRAALDEPAQGH